MKKICKKCGRNRRIGKFGKHSRYKDGRRIYCKDCIRERNLLYKKTNTGKLKHKKTVEKWRAENKEAISNYNREYYKKNKNRILYNIKSKKETECVFIFDEEKSVKSNKKENIIEINPKRKKNA